MLGVANQEIWLFAGIAVKGPLGPLLKTSLARDLDARDLGRAK
jgi:hypothetical protein